MVPRNGEVGSDSNDAVRRACTAALEGRSVVERTFKIELTSCSGWPNPMMVAIAPGRCQVGEDAQREVRISYPFALGIHPVTFAEWDVARASNSRLGRPGDQGWGRDRRPAINVSWNDAQAYISWLNCALGLTGGSNCYRLPSEAEWEYACRAGWATAFNTGAMISKSHAQFNADRTAPVGSFAANPFGLLDMHGNVWEWCEDVWRDDWSGEPSDGSAWTTEKVFSERVLRGGCWNSVADGLRSAARNGDVASARRSWFGFRLARTLPPA